MKETVIRARCEQELADRVEALAKRWNLKPSDIVRQAVHHYVATNEFRPNPLNTLAHADPHLTANSPVSEYRVNSPQPKAADPIARSVSDIAQRVVNKKRKLKNEP